MKLTWYGQAAFLIEAESGYRIICDPYNPELLGFPPIDDACDVVITSSANDDAHCRHDLVPGEHIWLNALELAEAGGSRVVAGLEVQAIEAMEMLNHPMHDPEQNAMYRFVVDGLHVAHMGDIGNPLSERQLAFLQGVDVLLALAGGEPVVTLDELMRVIARTEPGLVVPMHFRTGLSRQPGLLPVGEFIALAKQASMNIVEADVSTVSIDRRQLPEQQSIMVIPQAGS